MASTIQVKQGCSLPPTHLSLYIDEVSHYIERFGGLEVCLVGTSILILLYADDIALILDSPKGLQRPRKTLKSYGLTINMDSTKVIVHNTTQA